MKVFAGLDEKFRPLAQAGALLFSALLIVLILILDLGVMSAIAGTPGT